MKGPPREFSPAWRQVAQRLQFLQLPAGLDNPSKLDGYNDVADDTRGRELPAGLDYHRDDDDDEVMRV